MTLRLLIVDANFSHMIILEYLHIILKHTIILMMM